MRTLLVFIPVLFLTSCGKSDSSTASSSTPAADLPHATVVMRDGSRAMGTVASSTPSEITLNVGGGGTKTIAMKDVRRVDYGDAPAAASQPAVGAPAPAPEPTHDDHYHPTVAAVATKTHVVAAG